MNSRQHTALDIDKNEGYAKIDYGKNPILEQEWGHIYSPSRIWCLVPSLYPRNADNMWVRILININ